MAKLGGFKKGTISRLPKGKTIAGPGQQLKSLAGGGKGVAKG